MRPRRSVVPALDAGGARIALAVDAGSGTSASAGVGGAGRLQRRRMRARRMQGVAAAVLHWVRRAVCALAAMAAIAALASLLQGGEGRASTAERAKGSARRGAGRGFTAGATSLARRAGGHTSVDAFSGTGIRERGPTFACDGGAVVLPMRALNDELRRAPGSAWPCALVRYS